jgi:hypothetical protein
MAQARAFASRIEQYIASTALEEGDSVMVSGISSEPNPVPGVNVTHAVPKVQKIISDTGSDRYFLGVVRNAAAANAFVDVVVEGNAKAKVVTDQALSVGTNLVVAATGALGKGSGDDYVAKSGEAKTTSGTELVEAWISPVPIIEYAPPS